MELVSITDGECEDQTDVLPLWGGSRDLFQAPRWKCKAVNNQVITRRQALNLRRVVP